MLPSSSGSRVQHPSGALSRQQQEAVRASWAKAAALGAEEVGVLLFQKIFQTAPEALQLFSFRDEADLYKSGTLRSHATKVVSAVGAAVAKMDDNAGLNLALRSLGRRHAYMGLEEAHFEVVGRALIATLKEGLGASFARDVEKAWTKLYGLIQATMLAEMAAAQKMLDSALSAKGSDEDSSMTPTTASDSDVGGLGGPPSSIAVTFPPRVETEPTCNGTLVEGRIRLSTHVWATHLAVPEKQAAQEVDQRDRDTPDNWVKRHPDMVRLTGRHPFNSEPPLRKLQEAGWVTPASLHVVRNHGSVPKLSWDEHRLHVSGVPRPCQLTMDELASGKVGPVVSIPVSFICAGNRRKEQNMTKKTIGFNWGAAAVANSVWTGVRLCDVLAYLGITKVSMQHQYVHFEGPEGELPQGTTGSYGTSIAMGWALDRERDVLLAFKQNGEPLTPDHGAPLRTLLPGCIGGRMIKWLTKMSVSDKPSENHYHFFDNRVLPPHVDAELATAEGWWYKPEYIINHININSAMFEPRHNAFFPLEGSGAHPTMKVSGYAYVGGGLKIIRAEISLDGGKSWEIASLTRPEDEIAAARGTDKHWCWAWWETEVEASRLRECKEICCRAVDSNQNMQPAHLTWNVMGMMNNCLFRIKVHAWTDSFGVPCVWFEHPTMPGNERGGWMTEDAGKFDPEQASLALPGPRGAAPRRPVAAVWGQESVTETVAASKVASSETAPVISTNGLAQAGRLVNSKPEWLTEGISMEEVSKHSDEKSAWIVVNGRVYDCTPFLEDHPGGASSILLVAGQEATEDFEAVHSKKAWTQLEDYFLGPLKTQSGPLAPLATPASKAEGFLKKQAQPLPLIEKIVVSHDTRIFRFGLPSPSMRLGLPTGMHMLLKAKTGGAMVMRPYSPMTDDTTLGHVDLLVKVYFAGVHPRFPDGGKMSQHLESMQIGDTIDVKGPLGEFIYEGSGSFSLKGKPGKCSKITLIAGGTGLTPCFQVLAAALREAQDVTQLRLLYANRTPDDILMRQELDSLVASHPNRFKLHYTVDQVPEGATWDYSVGFVTKEMMGAHLFPAGDDTIALMCGPPPMTESAKANLKSLGYKEANLVTL